jgi:hypothetical protein
MLLKLYFKYLLWDVFTIVVVLLIIMGADAISSRIGLFWASVMAVSAIIIAVYLILFVRNGKSRNNKHQ